MHRHPVDLPPTLLPSVRSCPPSCRTLRFLVRWTAKAPVRLSVGDEHSSVSTRLPSGCVRAVPARATVGTCRQRRGVIDVARCPDALRSVRRGGCQRCRRAAVSAIWLPGRLRLAVSEHQRRSGSSVTVAIAKRDMMMMLFDKRHALQVNPLPLTTCQ